MEFVFQIVAAALGMIGVPVLLGVLLSRAARKRVLKSLGERPVRRAAVVVDGDRVFYVAATARAVDTEAVRRAWTQSDDKFVWASSTPMDPVRGILWMVATPERVADPDDLRAALAEHGLAVESLAIHEEPYDDAARARETWWVAYLCHGDHNLAYHCDGLEWWLDIRSGEGLWWLKAEGRRFTSVQAEEAGFRYRSGRAGWRRPPLGKHTLAEMATPAAD